MQYSHEVQNMCQIAKGPNHGPAPIPVEGKWVQAKEVTDISGLTHGVGWCAPQQGACKLTLNVKNGIIEEALVETLGCSGMTHSYGCRDTPRQDHSRSSQYRSRMRRYQYGYERTIPSDCLRKNAIRFL